MLCLMFFAQEKHLYNIFSTFFKYHRVILYNYIIPYLQKKVKRIMWVM